MFADGIKLGIGVVVLFPATFLGETADLNFLGGGETPGG